ncbi:CLUMA_CG021152, isoform A [Clunio marinus]|uniref:CLUMA_CG021152, isoform A n=1 Tax=Clunio marinus TaxID=568069 RepID=A0A1J1J8Z6_9DIPT|nr:CLUMA_CG021152, isoform A [Clunio marinus]
MKVNKRDTRSYMLSVCKTTEIKALHENKAHVLYIFNIKHVGPVPQKTVGFLRFLEIPCIGILSILGILGKLQEIGNVWYCVRNGIVGSQICASVCKLND